MYTTQFAILYKVEAQMLLTLASPWLQMQKGFAIVVVLKKDLVTNDIIVPIFRTGFLFSIYAQVKRDNWGSKRQVCYHSD